MDGIPGLQTTVGGLRAVELRYRPVREIATGRTAFFQSRTQLNTPELGTLMPEVFRDAAEFSGQSRKLFPLELLQLLEGVNAFAAKDILLDWHSVQMPLRILHDANLPEFLSTAVETAGTVPGRVCFSYPEEILSKADAEAVKTMTKLRQIGFHLLLCGFGESGCPFMRLSEIPFDFVMISPAITQYIGKGERSEQAVKAIISFVEEIGCQAIADGVRNSTHAEALYGYGCSYCAGSLAGNYTPVSEILQTDTDADSADSI